MGVYIWKERLPSAYQEVEYIQSSGSQYIDTGFYPTGSSEIEFDFNMYDSSSAYGLFGVDSGWTVNAFSVFRDRIFCYGNQYQSESLYFDIGTRYKLEFKNLTCYLNGSQRFTYTQQSFTSNYSAYLFAKRRNNYIEMYGKVRVFGLKLRDNGTLIRDFVPCYRKSDGEIGLYDLVNDVFYTNSGSGTFAKGQDVNYVEHELKNAYIGEYSSRLPSEYQEVEYIQSSGTQYIDTGHQHTSNSKVELKFSCQSMSTQWNCIFGSRQSNISNNAFGFGAQYSSNIWASVGGYDNLAIANISVDTIYEISMSKNDFTINGTSTALTTNLSSYGYSDLLFSMNENGNPNPYNIVKAKMYYCKIYESNTLVRDLVPCYRIADGVIGMYDVVNDVFYTNSGSGIFTKGPDVN